MNVRYFKIAKCIIVALSILSTLRMLGNMNSFASFGASAMDFIAAIGLMIQAGFNWLGRLFILWLSWIGVNIWEKKAINQTIVKVNAAKVNETKISATKVNETKVDVTKVNETKVNETNVNETNVNETNVDVTKVNETKVNETNADVTKVNETKVES